MCPHLQVVVISMQIVEVILVSVGDIVRGRHVKVSFGMGWLTVECLDRFHILQRLDRSNVGLLKKLGIKEFLDAGEGGSGVS